MSTYDWPSSEEWAGFTYVEKVDLATELLRKAAGNEHPRHPGGDPSVAVRMALYLVGQAVEEGPDDRV